MTSRDQDQFAHHRQTIGRMVARAEAITDTLGLIVIGSVTRGEAHERSDVDAMLVVADQVRPAIFDASDLAIPPAEGAGGLTVDLSYLRAAAERAPEPTRFAFVDAIVVLSRDPEIDRLVTAIPIYPDQERDEKMASFASQLPMHFSFMELADYSQNPYLLTETAHELALFGGRLILAHNRLLYPGRKQFLPQLERAEEKPDSFMELMTQLLRHSGISTAQAFTDVVLSFRAWPEPAEGASLRYQRDRDLAWLDRPAALAES